MQKTHYTGGKMMDADEKAYERIRTVDEDDSELTRLWDELRPPLVHAFKGIVTAEGMGDDEDTYTLGLEVDDSFRTVLLPAMRISLFNYFVYGIIAGWYMYTNKAEAAAYAAMSSAALEELKEGTYRRAFLRQMFP